MMDESKKNVSDISFTPGNSATRSSRRSSTSSEHMDIDKCPPFLMCARRNGSGNDGVDLEGGGIMADDPRSRYVLRQRLRKTIYGELYAGTDLTTGETVAVKVSVQKLRKQRLSRAGVPVFEDPAHEVEMMRRVTGHPHIVELVDCHDSHDLHWVVQKLEKGGDLFDLLSAHGHFSESVARHFFVCVLAGLHHIHQAGLCHLDLSLENVLVDDRWYAKICDFGVARSLPAEGGVLHARSDYKPGKLRYMAPEIYAGKDFDGIRADIFSAGVLLFNLLTGSPPYEKPCVEDPRYKLVSHGHVSVLVEALRVSDRVPPLARDLLNRMLSHNPNDRPSSVLEVVSHPWLQELRRV